jgi:hypothetical protein
MLQLSLCPLAPVMGATLIRLVQDILRQTILCQLQILQLRFGIDELHLLFGQFYEHLKFGIIRQVLLLECKRQLA